MKPSKELWLVSEYGGQYEDKWEHALGVFPTEELAKEFVRWHNEIRTKDLIPPETYDKLVEELDKIEDFDEYYEHPDSYWINKFHPEYSVEIIEMSEQRYANFYEDSHYWIEKINYYG